MALKTLQRANTGLSAPISREDFLRAVPRPVLEIGPFDRPALTGDGVFYFDVLSQEGLRARARTIEGFNPDTCPFIHYVSEHGDLKTVDRKFAAVFSSHVIEHQVDLVRHLNDVASLLEPGGAYHLIIPDKRYCFDHYLPQTRPDDVVGAIGRTYHLERSIIAAAVDITHNEPLLHWLGVHGRRNNGDPSEQLARLRRGDYVDVHAWQFTPRGFLSCVRRICELGRINLRPEMVWDTAFGSCEFMAVLIRAP